MLKSAILFLGFCLNGTIALRCIACAHDPGSAAMPECTGTLNATVAGSLIRNCTNPDDDLCYTSVSWGPELGENNKENRRWNRGCCHRQPGDPNCPTGKSDHEKNDWYEIWRSRCSTSDGCNVQAPAGSESSSGGGGGGGGGGLGECTDINDCRIIVPVKTGLATQNMAGMIVLTIATTAHLIF